MMRDSDRRNIVQSLLKMNTPTWLTLALAVFTFATPAHTSEPRVVCYYTNWSVYRPGTARFNPQNINPYLCTHLIYAFGGFTKENTLKPFDKYQDIEKGGYAKFTGLKTYNKNLKTMLAIGGWNEGSARFSPMVASKERRKEFVRNAIKFLRQNRFDGLDLDWEYPAFRDGGKPKDRENYAKLVRELREEFDREAEKTGRPRLLLTMAVPAGIEYIQKGFDVKTLNQYLDWMNLLTYDYHSAFEPAVNHHAPLYPLEEPSEYSVDSELNIDYTIKFYLENGADRDKLVLGIPTYGRSYTLFNPDAVDIGSPADGPGEQGDATREKGYLAYYEICEALKPKQKKRSSSDEESEEEDDEDQPWAVMQPNPSAMGPVAYRGNQWVGYDDVDIVKKKAEYVAENGLGGIMFWSIDNDDFRGNCHGKPYPLIEAAKEAYIVTLGSTDNAIVTDKPRALTTSRASSRRKSRPRSSTTTTTPKPSTNKRKSAVTSTTPSWNNTPEPPTTPDPGSDFKCTDEGFFQHPRDCKKYFWCLDSGPSNLGIVAHQFTCPSGLFFNKAADSCDFARNVLCKKSAATTEAPATKGTTTKATTTSTTTTTRRPVKLSTKSSALFRTTTTTTTPEPEEEEYEDEEVTEEEAQDPKVIKELIDLIKKVGGVEQLEKHLHLAESSMSTDGAITTTPSSFNKKLYQKVLEKARANRLNTLSKATEGSSGAVQNSRGGPQNAGLESASDKDKLLRKDRPQYTTIQRNRPAKTSDPIDEEDPEVPDVPQQLARSRLIETEVKVATTAKPLQYVNIRRARPTSDTADDTASRNALFERPESFVAVSQPSLDISSARRENMPEYVTIRRQRPTTEEATTVRYENEDKEEESQETALERELSSPSSQPQYTSIVRTRSTTLNPPEEKNSPEPPEPTTILAVQIASLLNSPSASEEPEAETTIAEATTADATTTSRPTTTTTTTTTTPAPSTRRVVQRRRGSTTSTTPSSTTTQVSPRNYSFVRRRRPIVQNEISSGSDEDEGSRKIRSTTPDSREVDGIRSRDYGQARKPRVRLQQTQAEDSVPAAASPVSRGHFKAKFTRDEVLSLTPIDVIDVPEVPQFVQKQSFNSRSERRFRGRTSTTVADSIADSEASAATIEIKRPSIVPRGRGRFTPSSTTQALDQSEPTEVTPSQRRPAFTRFTPRPFTRTSVAEENIESETEAVVTSRIPARLPFGRTRAPALSTSTTGPGILARRVPFSRQTTSTTTEQPLFAESDDLPSEEKLDDISLSESIVEEKEHADDNYEAEDQPKRRIVIKKLRTPSSTTENAPVQATEKENITDENGRKKIKIIRRRPSSTTESLEVLPQPTESSPSNQNRIRKVIRKFVRPVEDEPEIIAKSIGSLSKASKETTTEIVFNYGEKTRPTIVSSTLAPKPTEIVEEVNENNKQQETTEQPTNTDENDEAEQTNQSSSLKEIKNEEEATPTDDVVKDTEQKTFDLSENNQENNSAEESKIKSEPKPEIAIETEQKSIDLSENNEEGNSAEESDLEEEEATEKSEAQTTTTSTTQQSSPSPSSRARVPYRPPKRLFTSTTESTPSSSRSFSRKFNSGVYTSPSTVSKTPEAAVRTATRRPLFSSRTFTRRPFTTARTTTKTEDEEEEYSDEEFEEEEENPLVLVPPNKLFTRRPRPNDNKDENQESEEDLEEEDEISEPEEPRNRFVPASRQPFRPKAVNSNTFRTSTSTTELPKRTSLNRTSIYNRFGGIKPVNDTKKRVQNVPVGYSSPVDDTINSDTDTENKNSAEQSTASSTDPTDLTTEDDDYLTMTEAGSTSADSTNTSGETTNTIESETTTYEMEIDDSTDDFLEYTENTTNYPTTQDSTTSAQYSTENENSSERFTVTFSEPSTGVSSTEAIVDTTTAQVPPVVKTQYDKLFSVSRVVEVNSKLDKHRLNKNNKTTLVEEGKVMVETKPRVDKIGEVSRYSLIKIFEDEIPIYLTKLGHVYPVENPPDNLIRIDEARNARALVDNFADVPRENLIASESMNEAYRHINKETGQHKDGAVSKSHVEYVSDDNFLSYVNFDRKPEKPEEDQSYLAQWQFVPAAYENERNRAAKSFEIITPRSMLTEPSTLSLEGLFRTETPVMARQISDKSNQPFVVYSASVPTQNDDANIVKLQVLKPESGRSIITFAKGQEFSGASVTEEATIKYPVNVSVIPSSSEPTVRTTVSVSESTTTSPIVEMLTTTITITNTVPTTTILTTTETATTETVPEETTTVKSLFDTKRKFAFPRRPIAAIKPSNITRATIAPRLATKKNATTSSTPLQRANKTTGFNPNKSRFSGNRGQNVPIDVRKKATPKLATKTFTTPRAVTTDVPRTTTERKLYFKPIRPIRPAFVPRRNTTPSPQVTGDT